MPELPELGSCLTLGATRGVPHLLNIVSTARQPAPGVQAESVDSVAETLR